MYQDRLSELEGKSDKFVQKFNDLLDFTDHADSVFQKSGTTQKRTVLKLCVEGFTMRNQKLTPIWTPVFDVLMDIQVSKFDPPKVSGKGSQTAAKTLAVPKVLTWTSGGVYWTKFETISSKIQMIKNTNADSAGRNNLSGGKDSPCLDCFPARRRGLGRNAGGILNLSFFASEFRILQSKMRHQKRCCP